MNPLQFSKTELCQPQSTSAPCVGGSCGCDVFVHNSTVVTSPAQFRWMSATKTSINPETAVMEVREQITTSFRRWDTFSYS